jgi:hypothetical protein
MAANDIASDKSDRGRGKKSAATALLASAAFFLSASAVIRYSGSPAAIAGKYIIVLKDNASIRKEGVAAHARRLSDKYRGKLGHVYQHALHGFSVEMSETDARRLATDPDVAYIEQDQAVRNDAKRLLQRRQHNDSR